MSSVKDKQLFLFGPPRSGTTFLTALLNAHPRILITNELRALDFVNAVMRDKASDHHLIHNAEYRQEFILKLEPCFARLIEEFYVEKLRAKSTEPGIWGDKTPGYGDPRWSSGCLETIDRLFPEAKFILVVRNPLAVVNSIVAKRWETLDGAVDLWSRIIVNGRRFGRQIGAGRFLEISHEKLSNSPFEIIAELDRFLDLGPCPEMRDFLAREEEEATPYSDPVSMAGKTCKLTEEQLSRLRELLGAELNDIKSALEHYAGVGKSNPFGFDVLQTERTPLTFSVGTSICSGEGEVRISAFDLTVNGERRVLADLGSLAVDDEIIVEMDLDASRPIEKLVVGYILTAEDGEHLHSETSVSRGLKPRAIRKGHTRAVQRFRWPGTGGKPCRMTLVVGEGDHPTNHVRQCWAHEVVRAG